MLPTNHIERESLMDDLVQIEKTIDMINHFLDDSLKWNREQENSLPDDWVKWHNKYHKDIRTIINSTKDSLIFFKEWVTGKLMNSKKAGYTESVNEEIKWMSAYAMGKLGQYVKNEQEQNNDLRDYLIKSSFKEKFISLVEIGNKLKSSIEKSDLENDAGTDFAVFTGNIKDDFYESIGSWYQFLSKTYDIVWMLNFVNNAMRGRTLPI